MNYFLDTSFVIDIINKKPEALNKMSELDSTDADISINQLVFMETLRGISTQKPKFFQEAKDIIQGFRMLEIKPEIINQSVEFSRFCTSEGLTIKGCAAIDYIHFTTAKYYKLEMVSFDEDMQKLENKYPDFLKHLEAQKT